MPSDSQQLPSIIIDPSLSEPPPPDAHVAATSADADPASQPVPSARPVSMAAGDSQRPSLSAGDSQRPSMTALDAAAADKFASKFRPSWEPPAAAVRTSIGPKSSLPPAAHSSRPAAATSMRVVSAVDVPDDFSALTGKKERKRAMIWTVSSVAGFLVLATLGVWSSTTRPPPPTAAANAEHTDTEKTAEPANTPAQPNAPAATSAAAATPEPAAPAVVAAPVADPQPAASTETPAAASATTTVSTPTPTTPTPAIEPIVPAPAPSNSVQSVRLRVSTKPEDAKLFLDDTEVPNPFDANLPQGGAHRVEARADGYEASSSVVKLDHDARISLALSAVPKPKPSKPKAAAPRPKAAVVATPHKTVTRSAAAKPKVRGAGFVSDSPY